MAKRSVKPEDLYRVRTVGDPSFSPDGRRVAWVQAEVDESADRLATTVWVAAADGSAVPRRFSEGPADHSPRWSPDGSGLVYVATPDSGRAELRLAPLSGGVPRRLGDFPGPVSQPAWSPDSGRIAVVVVTGAPGPDRTARERNAPRLVRGLSSRYDNVGWYDGRRHVFLVDAASGEVRQLTDGEYDDVDPAFSPDGETVAFVSDRHRGRDDRQNRSDVYVVAASGGRPRRLTAGLGRALQPAFSPDGRSIAFVGHEGGDSWNRDSHVFVMAAGGGETCCLAPATDRPVPVLPGAPPPFRWLGNDRIALLLGDAGAVTVHVASVGRDRSEVVVGGDRQVDGFAIAPDGRTLVFTSAWPDTPSECYRADLAEGRATSGTSVVERLSRANDDLLAEVDLGPVARSSVTVADGTTVEYFTIRPPASADRRLPVHLDVHGGPHGWWPSGRFLGYHQAIAAAGYTVVLPNPRGSAGYGQEFTSACTGDWGGADAGDILACVDDVIARGLGDARRQFVSGGSYGGFMTAWLAARTSRFSAAAAMAAVIDQRSMYGTSDIPGFVEFNMGLPWEAAGELELRSPLATAGAITTPMLILHWEGDLRVPISQSEELYAELRRRGRTVEFARYPGGSHISRSPSQNVDWTQRLLAWNRSHDPGSGVGRRRRV